MTEINDDLLAAAHAIQPRVVALRRSLHRHPEIGLDLPGTRKAVLEEIGGLGLDVTSSATTSAVLATLTGERPGPTVLLRADMDALPLWEGTGLAFASQVDGAMHACGHDLHTAMLAGAVRLLAARRGQIAGRVAFFFQPGEEGYFGAKVSLDEGLLDLEDVERAFALHVTTSAPSGTIAVRPGPQLAAGDTMSVTVRGHGGHGSAPDMAADPIPVACEIVTALQTMVTRTVNAFDPVVVTVTHVEAGTTRNVIPETAWFEGTIRTLDQNVRTEVHRRVRRVAEGLAAAHDMSAEVTVDAGYPATINDQAATARVREVAAGLLGAEHSVHMPSPVMGAEDFSFVLERYPGALAFLGACPPDAEPGKAPWNHSNVVRFDEGAMTAGVATYAAVALDALR